MSNVLLSEATRDQFFDELMNRYPHHVFAGVAACQKDEGFEFHQTGAYLMKRGLFAVIGEHLDNVARVNFEEFYYAQEIEEAEDDDPYMLDEEE